MHINFSHIHPIVLRFKVKVVVKIVVDDSSKPVRSVRTGYKTTKKMFHYKYYYAVNLVEGQKASLIFLHTL